MSTTRTERLDRLRHKRRVSVLVIGGGINGLSTYRELALQGIDVVLVERGDFMSGASSAPSRMIHGGLRYMENGEFGLVRESLRERNLLLNNAPHFVSMLPTLIPLPDHLSGIGSAIRRLFGGSPRPGPRGSLIVKLGLSLYDFYAGRERILPRNRFFGRRATRKLWPAFDSDIRCAALYYDAKVSYPERLGVEMVIDAERDAPQALAINYLGFDGVEGKAVHLSDRLGGESFALEADIIVNATGAWVDLTNASIDADAPKLIGATKGSHLILHSPALLEALGDKMVYFANRDGRVCILFAHFGNVLAGSTDISVDSPDMVRCEDDETDYILESVREVFPAIAPGKSQILFRFSGVRPLPRSDSTVNAAISRDHRCDWSDRAGAPAVLNLIGGKWTTFRAFGAEAADLVLARLGARRSVSTENMPIGGGLDFRDTSAQRQDWRSIFPDMNDARFDALLARYGTRVWDFTPAPHDDALRALPSYSRDEVRWVTRNEHVATLADLVLRRMAIALTGELSLAALSELATTVAPVLNWTQAECEHQVHSLVQHLAAYHGLDAETLAARSATGKEPHVLVEESPHEPAVRARQMS